MPTQGPVNPNTLPIQKAGAKISQLEKEIRDLEFRKQRSTDQYNSDKAKNADNPKKLKQIELAYLNEQASLNAQIQQRQNEILAEKEIISNEEERIKQDLDKGVYLDPSGNPVGAGGIAEPIDMSQVTPGELPAILSRQRESTMMNPAQFQNKQFAESWVDPVTKVRWKNKDEYRKFLQRRIDMKFAPMYAQAQQIMNRRRGSISSRAMPSDTNIIVTNPVMPKEPNMPFFGGPVPKPNPPVFSM